jgi:uncharacterized RDD family membrane protein YckC
MPAMSPALRQAEHAKLVRDIVTPEGVPIRFTLAPAGDRAAAFMLDMVIQCGVVVAVVLGLSLAVGGADRASWLTPFVIILAFFIVNFYFAFFEVRWQGATPGKRKLGLRVIDARGGQLETSAVLARNLVRELEVWTPLRFMLAKGTLWPDAPGWALVLAIAWTLVILLLPLLNRDRLRVGDLVGGTRVVLQPKPMLLPDLVDEPATAAATNVRGAPTYTFTETQLEIYGIYELQVLEGLLRQEPTSLGYFESVRTVTEKIRDKLTYQGRVDDDQRFLRDFYAALRAHLEQRILFGQRREDKFSDKR